MRPGQLSAIVVGVPISGPVGARFAYDQPVKLSHNYRTQTNDRPPVPAIPVDDGEAPKYQRIGGSSIWDCDNAQQDLARVHHPKEDRHFYTNPGPGHGESWMG